MRTVYAGPWRRRKSRLVPTLVALIVIGQLLDLLTTLYAFSLYGYGAEGNPLMEAVLTLPLGILVLPLVKIAFCGALIFVFANAERNGQTRWTTTCALMMTALSVFVVVNNVVMIGGPVK